MHDLIGHHPAVAVVADIALLVHDPEFIGIQRVILDALFQILGHAVYRIGQLGAQLDIDDTAVHAPPVVKGLVLLFFGYEIPAAIHDIIDDALIEDSPLPGGGGQRQLRAVFQNLIRAPFPCPGSPAVTQSLPVGDHIHILTFKQASAVGTGPVELDPCPGIGHAGADGKSIDACRDTEDRVVCHIADVVGPGHGAGNGAGQEFALVDAAVVGTHTTVGHGEGAVQHPHIGILCRDLSAGLDQRRRGGKDDLRAFGHSLFHGSIRFPRYNTAVGADGHFLTHDALQIHAAHIVGGHPGALIRRAHVDKGHMQMAHAAALLLHLHRLRANGDLGILRLQLHIAPDGGKASLQLRGGHGLQIGEGVQLQPHQQRLRNGDGQLFTAQLVEGLPEPAEAGQEPGTLVRRPHMIRLIAQNGLQLGITAGLLEIQLIQACKLIKLDKLEVGLHRRLTGLHRHETDDTGRDHGSIKALEHADPLIALFHIELA